VQVVSIREVGTKTNGQVARERERERERIRWWAVVGNESKARSRHQKHTCAQFMAP
jgi:hypothetical protein